MKFYRQMDEPGHLAGTSLYPASSMPGHLAEAQPYSDSSLPGHLGCGLGSSSPAPSGGPGMVDKLRTKLNDPLYLLLAGASLYGAFYLAKKNKWI